MATPFDLSRLDLLDDLLEKECENSEKERKKLETAAIEPCARVSNNKLQRAFMARVDANEVVNVAREVLGGAGKDTEGWVARPPRPRRRAVERATVGFPFAGRGGRGRFLLRHGPRRPCDRI